VSIMASALPPAREIPTTFGASLRNWWAAGEKESAASEERLLRKLSFFVPSSSKDLDKVSMPVTARVARVALSTTSRFINTLSIIPAKVTNAAPPAVLVHGYGAGLGFYTLNYPSLGAWSARRGVPIYSLDWLGMGRSARVPFKVKAKKNDIQGRVREAESFFVDSLEEWRQKMNLEQMTLVGHSLGAYFSVAYALRYPTRVSRLVLLSPAGVPRGPNTTVPSQEIAGRSPSHITSSENTSNSSFQAVQPSEHQLAEIREEQLAAKKEETRIRKLGTYLWEEGWSPFQLLRSLSAFAPLLIGKYSSRRFNGLTEEFTRDLHDYILNITLAKGSGEYCVSHVLAPGAHARMPLVDRISTIKVPVTFVYGDSDWMDPKGGEDSIAKLKAAGNSDSRMFIIPEAGHHLYMDNPTAVDRLLINELEQTLKR